VKKYRAILILLVCLLGLGRAGAADPATNAPSGPASFISRPLSLEDAVNIALRQNPGILRAQKDLEASQGVVAQTRAIALPKVKLSGSYSAIATADVDRPAVEIGGFTFGTDQSWSAQLRLVQSLYEGGRMVSSVRAARLTKERALLDYQTAVANMVLAVQVAYYDVLLAAQQIIVQEASVELLESELADTTRRFEVGTVPRFNVLRAQVELANAKPKLIRARNNLRIDKNTLANLLGFNIPKDATADIPLSLSDKLEAEPYHLELSRAIGLALERRTELASLAKTEQLRAEDVSFAKGGYKPSLQAFGGYETHSSIFSPDLSIELHGWIAGVQMSWDIFDGLQTQGKVTEAAALHQKSQVELDDARRNVELEVRTAHSSFVEAQEVLESQKKAVEEAEEALRLASARFSAGSGTQLDVLSAQTALTEARSIQVQALRDYEVARARLDHAVGLTTTGH
jgi:outer membrane protein TolC